MNSELSYIGLLAGLFILPKALQRLRIPSSVTVLAFGLGVGLWLPELRHDRTVSLLASFGILALFLFAGMEIEPQELRQGGRIIAAHLGVRVLIIAAAAAAANVLLGVDWRASTLVALALFTPSTGFIIDTLPGLPLTENERFWIKSKAIATEVLALAAMFVLVQAVAWQSLLVAGTLLLGLIAALPAVFRCYARHVAPYAPRSEFAFLMIIAILCGYATKYLGAYYLVGAFVVGVTVGLLRRDLPNFHSERNLHAVEVFASFFVPFYFFYAGLSVPREAFQLSSLGLGLGLCVVIVPLRILLVAAGRRLLLREHWTHALRVAGPLVPTLVFTLVLSNVLLDAGMIGPVPYGGLIVYAVLNSALMPLLFGLPQFSLDVEERFDSPPPGLGAAREEA